MEKILVAIDAAKLNTAVLDFACYIAKLTQSKLTGIFLENLGCEDVPVVKRVYGASYVETIVASDIPGYKSRVALCKENIRIFENYCRNRGISCDVHRDQGIPDVELIAESRFADLLIADPQMSFGLKQDKIPSGFVKELLLKSECPLVLAPYSFYGIEEILFAYDGSPSSVFAIRQFSYLFPRLAGKKITILEIAGKSGIPVTEKDTLIELLQAHYCDIRFWQLEGNASDELFGFLLEKKNLFVVMGAYGRSLLSGFFRPSTADLVVKTVNLPVFIAHH